MTTRWETTISKRPSHLTITGVDVTPTEITVTGSGATSNASLGFEASYTPDDGTAGREWQESGFQADVHGNFSFQLGRTGLNVPGSFKVDVYTDKAEATTRVTS